MGKIFGAWISGVLIKYYRQIGFFNQNSKFPEISSSLRGPMTPPPPIRTKLKKKKKKKKSSKLTLKKSKISKQAHSY